MTDLYADTDGLSAYYVLFCVLIMELFIKNNRNIMEMKEFFPYYICAENGGSNSIMFP